MKRSQLRRKTPLRTKKPLDRRTPLESRASLKRTGWLRRKPKEPLSAAEKAAKAEWDKIPWAAQCIVCGRTRAQTRMDAHHCVTKQKLKKVISARKLSPLLLWDLRNRAFVCRHDHDRHTTGFKRIKRNQLPRSAEVFARELGLTYVLERDYR